MKDPVLIVFIVAVGLVLAILIKNEINIRRLYKDGSTKTPYKHPPNSKL